MEPPPLLVESKFRAHPARRASVRPRLMARLAGQEAARLVLIRAPAGYGKSTLLAQWRDRLLAGSVPHGWLTLDAGDRTAADLLPYLVRALQSAGFAFEPSAIARAAEQAPGDPRQSARTMLAGATPPKARGTLLIDGLDLLDAGDGVELIRALVDYAERLQIVATAQRRPALPLSRLRAAGILHEITSSDLRFSAAEVEALFETRLPFGYAESLRARTDGVAVALQFARASVDPSEATSPWTDWLDDYYREQILDPLPSELRAVVSRLVIVERFDASLASAIVGRDVSSELERLLREESLLSIDSRTGLFQFPALFRSSVRAQLQWLGHDEQRELHRRAEAWFTARGFLHEALLHALAAQDASGASSLFRQVGASSMVVRFGVPVLRAALEQMQPADAADGGLLGWSRVLLLTQLGRTSEAASLADCLTDGSGAGGRLTKELSTLEERESLVAATMLAAYADRRLPPHWDEALGRAAAVANDDRLYQGFISNLQCWMRYERAEFEAADGAVERAITEFMADGGLYGSLFMHLHRIIIRVWQNRLDEALAEATLLTQLQRLFFPADGRLRWLCTVFEAWSRFELGDTERAAAMLQDALDGLDAGEGWFEAQLVAHVVAARASAAQGQLAAAQAVLAHGTRLASTRGLPRLAWHFDLHRVELALQAGVTDVDVPPWLLFRADRSQDPSFFTWRERFQSGVLCARLSIDSGRLERAREILLDLEQQLAASEVPRARTVVTLLYARLASAAGDQSERDGLLQLAVRSFDGSAPVMLFAAEGFDVPQASDRGAAPAGPAQEACDGGAPLTEREREILTLLASGRPNKVIAHKVGLSEGTVKFHLRNIYRKLNARNRVEALMRVPPST